MNGADMLTFEKAAKKLHNTQVLSTLQLRKPLPKKTLLISAL
jgi:hypothetical protein